MCGRYNFILARDDFGSLLKQAESCSGASPRLKDIKSGDICPTDIVPIVTKDGPVLMRWGFSGYDGKGQVINARLETAAEKPMFRKSYAQCRCLVPAGHYFEWRKDGTKKQKYAIGTGTPMYMAGLYRSEPGDPLPHFVILTRSAAPGIAFIHDRMPVIVPESLRNRWLASPIGARELLSASDESIAYRETV
ncbi:Putative SOS response-associated peptidase YedK [Sporobacter termitidis DSM 10068]|uniref:Abasic site processing protein n=1 Tax=Sporobacter termitidis DSM 10068 TaxID=1123282 RepID=A0A1M5WVU3_9FIRM|nr:SOS response-associated peptidase [Sporobacter termitidis]SHH91488.1 Putative SOS response-associated peptidase YedK [Sporobacter termitidis DSM 10068]